MARKYSIAEARAKLPSLVNEAANGREVELTRRGKPVAVLLSCEEYARLHAKRPSFAEAYRAFRAAHRLEEVGIDADFFRSLRPPGEGRKVEL